MSLEGRPHNGNAWLRSQSELMLTNAQQHVLIGDNLQVRKTYFESNIIKIEHAKILRSFLKDYFEADGDKS